MLLLLLLRTCSAAPALYSKMPLLLSVCATGSSLHAAAAHICSTAAAAALYLQRRTCSVFTMLLLCAVDLHC
jgi:hypothetical protein